MGKGSKKRPTVVSDKQFQDNWEKAFGKKEPKVKPHKKTPKHGQTQVHQDKTKYKRKDKYPSPNYEGPWGKDMGLT